MIEKNKLISYAMDLASYLISKEKKINRIILYGSIARGDFDEESDIDLFVDVLDNKSVIEKRINKILDNYYDSKKYKEWELKGITNTFSIITGGLDSKEWTDLKRAIINTGIILYSKYKSKVEKVNSYTLFSFENIKPNKKRIVIFRKLFGFKVKGKSYPGLVDKINAIKIGKGALLVPIEKVNELRRYFQDKKVKVKLYDLWSDSRFI